MNREAQDAKLHINSFSTDSETPIIRSHRHPAGKVTTRRVLACVLALAVSSGGMAVANAAVDPKGALAPMQVVVTAPLVEVEQAPREELVSRSAARKASRTTRINKAINYALAQRGDRYRWGATGPSRWDCSGLVMKSFSKIGIKLPHYTGGMLKKGKKVTKKNLKRGDIIFPQRGHVAIYLGNGKMVAASSGKGKVVVQKVYGFYAARRLL